MVARYRIPLNLCHRNRTLWEQEAIDCGIDFSKPVFCYRDFSPEHYGQFVLMQETSDAEPGIK
jgi:hypothetical protein